MCPSQMTVKMPYKQVSKEFPRLTRRSKIGKAGEKLFMDIAECHCGACDWIDLNEIETNMKGFDVQCAACHMMYQVKSGETDILKEEERCRIPSGRRHIAYECLREYAGKACYVYVHYNAKDYGVDYVVMTNALNQKCIDRRSEYISLTEYWVYTF